MNLRGKLITFLVFVIIIFFTWLMIHDKSSSSYIYPDFGVNLPEERQSLGIDVSHYQGSINWVRVSSMKVEEDSIGFVYIKCTEGLTLRDERCDENADEAHKVGIPFGLYHFFIPDYSARNQARFFAERCAELSDSLIPVLDMELRNEFTNQRLIDSVDAFMDEFEKLEKRRPMIYTNESIFEDYFASSYLKTELFWIANYNSECEAMELDNVIMWQFSESGTVNGIKGRVDLNVTKPDFWKIQTGREQ